jgi:transposase InsO family protein
MCRVLGVSRQGFYDWEARPPSARELTDRQLAVEIEAIWECSARTYGAPRVHAWLRRQGFGVARKRVARIMRSRGWVGVTGRRRVRTTIVDKTATAASDLVARRFDPVAPDVTWAGDITYVPTGEGWLFLATVIDLFSRRVLGWGVADHLRTPLVSSALDMAVATRGGAVDGVVFHSDRGCQYTSAEYRQHCQRLGVTQSMGATGICFDKALVSYCTSLRWSGGSSFGEAGAHVLDESGIAGDGGFEESDVLVVGLVGDEQAGAVPGVDGGDVHAETLGDLGLGEQPAAAESFEVAGHGVVAA